MSAPVTLAQLVTTSTEADALGLQLSIAQTLGLPTTAWQPFGMARTIEAINANVVSAYSDTIAFLAQGGYASYASLMVDASGNPVTTWMDLRGIDQYNVTRIPASFASGNVPLINASATSYTWSPNSPLHLQNSATGATYTTTGSGTVTATSTTPVAIQADPAYQGHIGTSGSGVTLILLTPLPGVTVGALTSSLVGSDAELNANYLSRCQAKLGSLSPNGPASAYQYVAESIPVFNTTLPTGLLFVAPTAQNPYGVSAPITRVSAVLTIGSGQIQVYAADAAGALSGCVELGITNVTWALGVATVTTASPHNIRPGQWVIISGVVGATGVNNTIAGVPAWQTVTASGSSFTFALASTPGAYSSGGSVEGDDLGMVDAAIQAGVVPDGQIAIVQNASNLLVNVAGTLYLKTSAGISAANAQTAISGAIANYLGGVPIGGVNAESNGIVPLSAIQKAAFAANTGTVSVVFTSPSADVVLTASQVSVLGSFSFAVVYE